MPPIPNTFLQLVKSKFASDSLWNIASVFFLGICGLILNFLIARNYNARVLGIFNLVYAVYILASQFSTLGVQVSTLKHIAEAPDDNNRGQVIIVSAFIVIGFLSSFFAFLLYLIHRWIAEILNSPGLAVGILFMIPGMWCFSINKLFLNVLNGYRKMKIYSLLITLRYCFIILSVAVVTVMNLSGEKLSVVFSVSELLLLVILLLVMSNLRLLSFGWRADLIFWIKKHILFGSKFFMGGVTSELNTRVDVLIIGYYWSDWHVGIYSFAAMIVEGVNQIPYVFKQNLDPIFAGLMAKKEINAVRQIIRQGRKWVFYGMFILGVALMISYPVATNLLLKNNEFRIGWSVFCILLFGAIIQNSYLPFSGILVQSGYPGLQTILVLSATITNIILNILLVPLFGINGAAMATAFSSILFVVYLRIITAKALHIS